jgi:broad specificity phosphatase PhoE
MIYLLRHGETLWNTAGRFQGHRDSPLTTRGLDQADYMGRLLAREIKGRENLFKIHVSPLGRARETAARITNLIPLDIRAEPRLAEVTIGSWDGMTNYEIEAEYPGALRGANAFDWYFRSPDGETFEEACARVQAWLSSISGPAIAISHGLIGRLVRGVYLGLTQRETLELPVPQDGFYRLYNGRTAFVE